MQEQARDVGRSWEPLDEVEELSLAGKHAEAQAALEKARQVYRSRQDRQGEAICSLLAASASCARRSSPPRRRMLPEGGATLASLGDPFGAWAAEWLFGERSGRQRAVCEPPSPISRGSLASLRR